MSEVLTHAGITVTALALTVVALKTDMKWIKKWCDDHQKLDDQRYHEIASDIRDLRHTHGRS